MVSIHRKHIDTCLSATASIWLERQQRLWSYKCTGQGLAYIDQQLQEHLSDLKKCGRRAVSRALMKLEEQVSPEHTFVTTYCLCCAFEVYGVRHLESLLEKHADLIAAASSALIWATPAQSEFFVERWCSSDDGYLRAAALPAALMNPANNRQKLIRNGLDDDHPGVRSYTYRSVGEWQNKDFIEQLQQAFHQETDSGLGLYEAAAALALLGDTSSLHYMPYAINTPDNIHWQRFLLVWAAISSDQQFEQWVINGENHFHNESHVLLAIALRGDPYYLKFIGNILMQQKQLTLSTYVIQHIVGSLHADIKHNPSGLYEWVTSNKQGLIPQRYYINGQLKEKIAKDMYQYGTQPQRWQAALYLTLQGEGGAMSLLSK
ncbi:hypothetical protein [Agarilytica rhodophyticola]|uniref:hypothetical protein n=1 Tax=Agarilytica rhodophyticola TaxID=1737490 RepID=UPI000B343250|nr:hypothetical protein [Agarilytica rhodophyticola]